MSGICGACQTNRTFHQDFLQPMLEGIAVDHHEVHEAIWGDCFTLGASKRFAGQGVGSAGEVSVAADTDLVNLEELRSAVKKAGRPAPSTVAALLASLYSIQGPDFVQGLDGAFAFALWDKRNRRLMLAIDRFGIKNIYWRLHGGCLTFATRIGALRNFEPSLELSPAALAQYLFFSVVPAPLTVYAGTEKMQAGHVLVFEQGKAAQHQYWDLQFLEEERPAAEWAERVRNELRASVHRQLANASAGATGAFLSGGTDSSTVVAFMSERQSPVRTFSVVFDESSYSEESFMRTTAERFGAEQHSCRLSPGDAIASIPNIIRYYDEPFANSSAIAAYFCAVTARQCGMDVLLGGDGGDELFAGNQRYETDKYFELYHRIPRMLRRFAIEPLTSRLPQEHKWLGLPRRYVRRALIPNPQRFFSYNVLLTLPAQEIFQRELLEQAQPERWLEIPQAHFDRHSQASELNRLLYTDVKMVLADNDLKKVSGMAELAGIQVRYPLLDHRLAQLAGSVPAKLKLRRFEKRYIFKRAMTGILPESVLYKKKHGMGVPISHWLLNDAQLREFAREVFHDRRTLQRGYFRPGFLERLVDLQRQEHVAYYGEMVWYLLALELWHREHFDRSVRLVCAG